MKKKPHIFINIVFLISLILLLVRKSQFPVILNRYSLLAFSGILGILMIFISYSCYIYGYLKGWNKLKKGYLFIASTVLSVIILLFILNMTSSLILHLINKINQYKFKREAASELALSKKDLKENLMADLLHLPPNEIDILKSETWVRGYEYEPWVGFRERPRSGKYVNIHKDGYRKTKDSSENPKYLILMFGGSTTFGYNVTDNQTIASYLQARINKQCPYGDFAVRNYGRAFYYADQEFELLIQLLRKGVRPHIVIFFDGLNEKGSDSPYYTKEMKILFEAQAADLTTIPLLNRVIRDTSIYRLIIENALNKNSRKKPKETIKKNREAMKEISENYVFAQKNIRAICKAYNISPYFFIQPVSGYLNNYVVYIFSSTLEEDQKTLSLKMELLSGLSQNGSVIDLSGLLSKYNKQPFIDNYHYTPEVNKMIADVIFTNINPTLRSLTSSKNKSQSQP